MSYRKRRLKRLRQAKLQNFAAAKAVFAEEAAKYRGAYGRSVSRVPMDAAAAAYYQALEALESVNDEINAFSKKRRR